jgi:hypothetical protein
MAGANDVGPLVEQNCVPEKVVAQLMGHAKVDTPVNVCTQVIDGSLRAALDKLRSELLTIVPNAETGASYVIETNGSSGWTRPRSR